MSHYYVYKQVDTNGEVVYVGKGSYSRAWDIKGRSSEHLLWMQKQLPNLHIIIVQEEMVEKEAFWLENDLIKELKPKFNNSFFKYGNENSNFKHGKRVGVRRNPKFKPNGEPNPNYIEGLKQGNSAKGIICFNTGETFPSTKEAAFIMGLDPSGITKVLKGKTKSTMGFQFSYT